MHLVVMYVKCVCCNHLWTDFEGRVSVFFYFFLLYAYRMQKREQYKRKKSAHYCIYVHKICSSYYPFIFNVSFYISCWMHMLPFKTCFSIYTIHNTMWTYVFSLTFKCNLSGPFWTLFSLLTTCDCITRTGCQYQV